MKSRLLMSACVIGLMSTTVGAAELKPGGKMPTFKVQVPETKGSSGSTIYSDEIKADVIVLCITCNGCPVAKAYEGRFNDFQKKYAKNKKVTFVAVNCNNKTESLQAVGKYATDKKLSYTYAFDDGGTLAKDLGARVTPHLFVFGKDRKLAYVGAFDDNGTADKVKENYVIDAVKAVLAGKTPETQKTKAVGCAIKAK